MRSADFQNLFLREKSTPVAFSARGSAFFDHVIHIILSRAEKKVVYVYTPPVIAPVADETSPISDDSVSEFPDISMEPHSLRDVSQRVSVFVYGAGPFDTSARGQNGLFGYLRREFHGPYDNRGSR